MLEELSQVIQKNLPAQISEQLQKRLKEGDTAIKAVDYQDSQIEKLQKKIKELEEIDRSFFNLKSSQKKLDAERQVFEIEKREWKIVELNEKYRDVKSLMSDVFRNQRIVYRKDASTSRQVLDQSGYPQTLSDHNSEQTEKNEE